TTSKLDAPVNKLARLLNSASIKRVLLNDSLLVDFDRVIAAEEVLIVKGALGAMGSGNTSVLMQLLIGMLDAALARQQDLVPDSARVAVALKVDEAPLVINRGFSETMALKRSRGLETVACWQSDAQWTDRDVRDQPMRHAPAQHARGGRPLSDFRQPHWDPAQRAPRRDAAGAHEPPGPRSLPLPASTAESYRELVELDRAQSVRRGGRVPVVRA